MKKETETTGLVLEIQKMSTEDGPGLRTTLFLKGCSLSCRWCHNPESISHQPQIRWIENRCIGCLECIDICPLSALEAAKTGIHIKRDVCTGCGKCADHCPSGALELWGRTMTCTEAFSELIKDKAYFGKEGGITVSGGEAALQPAFVEGLFKLLKQEDIHTALDTCGMCTTGQLRQAAEHADLILFDIKEIDPQLHKEFTGGSLEYVKRSFSEVVQITARSRLHSQAWQDHGAKSLWVRTPIIPGMTDRLDNITGIARYILDNGEGMVDRWELCAFNNLCRDKYRRLGRSWELEHAELLTAERMNELTAAAVSEGIDPHRVGWNGIVRNTHET